MSFPESMANRVLTALAISSIDDLYLTKEIAWERGALVLEERLNGAEARILISRPRSIITVSTAIFDENRRRFGASHELGHLEMHRSQRDIFNCSTSDLDSGGIRNRVSPTLENEANEFAASLLMPTSFFAPYCANSEVDLMIIRDIAAKFKVSITAAAIRFVGFCSEPVAIVCTTNGSIKWFDANQDFMSLGLFVNVGEQLSRETLAYNASQKSSSQLVTGQVPIRAWMRPGTYNQRATLAEQSLPMPNYASVLSLLWVNELIDDDNWPD